MFNLIVLATTNTHKIREIKRVLEKFPVVLKSLSDFPTLPEAIEDGDTFDENAYKKAFHYAKVLGLPTIADDSGLEVYALGGKPGVHSARYSGEEATDLDNCRKLLRELNGIQDRKARFVCVFSIAVPSGPALTYEASCEGKILDHLQGEEGFGYDPLFFYEPIKKTFAELSLDEKNEVSHRGKVLVELASEFPKVLKWIENRMKEELPQQPDHSEFMNNDWSR
ncbi:XTP/dITP diphosphatase [Desulfofustis limnaeus]|jgi:XTP/dITP diphosphohydrolase|uniref:dITP/XTP pyrophosphatase n=1 Tax=Desulfofustis limnaeus TaxID=2740163 RepID=A0ABM7WDP1_9BACT|nr:XTP/dITP diphosphatase [Desulfofustis limnaeus]BDD89091.1 non-canonical purine NTP pyrophosphatase [Desulfofustis limnaeus]